MFNVAQYALVRGGGILLVAWILLYSPAGLRTRSILMQAHAWTLLSLYAAFCAVYVFRQYSNIRARRPLSSAFSHTYSDGTRRTRTAIHATQDSYSARDNSRALRRSHGSWFCRLGVYNSHDRPGFETESLLLSHALGITISLAIFCARCSHSSWKMESGNLWHSRCVPSSVQDSGCMAVFWRCGWDGHSIPRRLRSP
ncbi:hypothetical protein R3P38DRAFT_3576864, partial [Favolaschia claudopus]